MPSPDRTVFFGSQLGDVLITNYSYTDSAFLLLLQDAYLCIRYLRNFPSVIFPLTPCNSGSMNELYPSPGNLTMLALQFLLLLFQFILLIALLPFATLPVWVSALYIAIFVVINNLVCWLFLNGPERIYWSHPDLTSFDSQHSKEQWVFINGVSTGQRWLQNSIDRLAITFRRPVMGIHNRT